MGAPMTLHPTIDADDAGHDLALLGVHVTGDLRGSLFEACVEQRFANPRDEHAELVYTFPLPWGAVLLEVEAELGGKRLVAAVAARVEADARYEEAIADGDAAVLLEVDDDGHVTANLGNLAPRETCTVRLRYAMTLSYEDHSLRLMLPTTIAPRYEGAAPSQNALPYQRQQHSAAASDPFDLALTLHGPLAKTRVSSPSHAVRCAQTAGSVDQGGVAAMVQE